MHITTYFYTRPNNFQNDYLKIRGKERHHVTSVLRNAKGDKIHVTDGEGHLFLVEIIGIEKEEIKCKIIEEVEESREPQVNITLGVGTVAPKKFSTIINHGIQLGLNGFLPIISDFSDQNKRVKRKWDKTKDRLRRKSIAAIKQCLRTRLPDIHPPKKIHDALCRNSVDKILYGDPQGLPTLPSDITKQDDIFLAVGPKGGFSDREKKVFYDWDAVPISLGKRRLRTETASLTLLIKILNTFGEI